MSLSSAPNLEFTDFTVQTLAPGVHAVIAKQMTGSIANAGIIDLGDRTLVFDTFMTLMAARDLQQAAIALTGRPATYVVNSHPHPDHVHGNLAFGADAVIIASAATRADLVARAEQWLEQSRQEMTGGLSMAQAAPASEQAQRAIGWFERLLAGLPAADELRYPTLTFAGQLSLHGSARSVQLLELGGGHSPSDAILWLPEERIVFTADVIVSGGHLVMEDGDPGQWLTNLDRVDELVAATIVPGHGRVQPPSATATARQYICDLLELAEAAAQDGITPELPERYKGYPYPQVFSKNMTVLLNRSVARKAKSE